MRQIRYIRPSQTAERSSSGDTSTCRIDATLWVWKVDIQGGQAIPTRTLHTPTLPVEASPAQWLVGDCKQSKAVELTGTFLVVPYAHAGTGTSSAFSRLQDFSQNNPILFFLLLLFLCIKFREISEQDEASTVFSRKGSASSNVLSRSTKAENKPHM